MPAGGKTGTTQNWADAWTCGITPYYSAAFWFGFDRPGQSLGLRITGSTLAGYAWGEYFGKVHADLPYKDWIKPASGVIQVTVCSESGQLLTEACGDHKTTQWYLEGTQPTEVCQIHSNSSTSKLSLIRLEKLMYKSGQKFNLDYDFTPLTYDLNKPLSASDTSDIDDENEEETETKDNALDYNYLME